MSGIISKTVESVLKDMDFDYEMDENLFNFKVSDEGADYDLRVVADDKNEILTVIGFYPVKASKDRIESMCRKLTDINHKKVIGFFAMDTEDGELSFRLANNVDEGAVNVGIVKSCICQVIMAMSKNYQDIMNALYGGGHFTFNFEDGDRPCT